MRASRAPVLTVREKTSPSWPRKILVPMRLASYADVALRYALLLSDVFTAKVSIALRSSYDFPTGGVGQLTGTLPPWPTPPGFPHVFSTTDLDFWLIRQIRVFVTRFPLPRSPRCCAWRAAIAERRARELFPLGPAVGGWRGDVSQTRRLAAILAADVAGYSRLMGVDEEGTLDRLKALRRDLVDPQDRRTYQRPHRRGSPATDCWWIPPAAS